MLSAIIILLTVFFSGSHQQCFSNNDTTGSYVGERYSQWIDSRNFFSVSLSRELIWDHKEKNVIISPSSVHELLLLTYLGAANETEESLAKVLRKGFHAKKSDIWNFYKTEKEIIPRHDTKQYPLKVANKLFFSNKLHLRPCIRDNLGSETEVIDYHTNVEWARHYINSWASNATEGEIKEAIKDLSPASTMVAMNPESTVALVNAVYFKAEWMKEFNPNSTKILPFYTSKTTNRKTQMMTTKDYFPVDDMNEIRARVLKMTYKGEKQAMYILLPHYDLDNTIFHINWHAIKVITSTDFLKRSREVEVVLPKFKATDENELNSVLKMLGIGNTLTDSADLSRFTREKGVFFTKVIHNAAIKVDEKGTTASAVTVGAVASSASYDRTGQLSLNLNPVTFICDRPFAYFIYDYVARKILFMGTYVNPPLETESS